MSRPRESVCDAVTVDRYGFSYRWFINRDTSKSTPRKCLSETRYDVSLTRVYVTRGVDVREGNDCDLLINRRYRKMVR